LKYTTNEINSNQLKYRGTGITRYILLVFCKLVEGVVIPQRKGPDIAGTTKMPCQHLRYAGPALATSW
jgi:hypothetical protein